MRGLTGRRRGAIALAAALLLASCGKVVPPSTGPAPPKATTAVTAGVRSGPQISRLGIGREAAVASLASFRESCPRLVARNDASGLTRTTDWKPACDAARSWPVSDAPGFFTNGNRFLAKGGVYGTVSVAF